MTNKLYKKQRQTIDSVCAQVAKKYGYDEFSINDPWLLNEMWVECNNRGLIRKKSMDFFKRSGYIANMIGIASRKKNSKWEVIKKFNSPDYFVRSVNIYRLK